MTTYGEYVEVEVGDDYVATVELCRPPNNFFNQAMMAALADALEALDQDDRCRASVLCSQGKHFCAGANFGEAERNILSQRGRHLYEETVRLFDTNKPIVAAVQGAAIGGGLGVALLADFRVAAPEARFSANFARIGFHHGFGLSVTLPRVVGHQKALDLLYRGPRLKGEQALAIGLCDELVPLDELRARARALAADIAGSAPLSIESIRRTMRGDLPELIKQATDRERQEQ
ncbi:MAG: enoyl-CoA hydratase/isomerase family protein, partial [Myxococcales bacterium]|nr:enoyl-CoA hydratase/isomerase family protein [Myxococcales bacterium]